MEFDESEWQAKTFWRSYAKMEEKKFNIPEYLSDSNDDSMSIPASLDSWSFLRFLRITCGKIFPLRFSYEPVLVIRRLGFWIRRSYYRIREEEIMSARAFQLLYIETSRVVGILLLMFSIASLVLMLFYFDGRLVSLRSDPGMMVFRSSARNYTLEWLLCNAICLVCLFPFLLFKKARDAHLLGHQFVCSWVSVGYAILMYRFLRIIYTLTAGYLENESCYGLYVMTNKEFGFRYIFYQLIQDSLQVFVFSALPFVWPWSFIFALEIAVDNILRTLTCRDLLVGTHKVENSILVGLITLIIGYCFISVAMIALHFQRSIRASGCHVEDQKKILQETKKIVDLLCTDVKLLLRQGTKVLGDVISQSSSSLVGLGDVSRQVQMARESVQSEVDNLVFLAKLGEGRFEYSKDKIDLSNTIISTIIEVIQKIRQMQFDARIDAEVSKISVTTDSRCLRVLILYGTMALFYFWKDHIVEVDGEKDNQSVMVASLKSEFVDVGDKKSKEQLENEEQAKTLKVKISFAASSWNQMRDADEKKGPAKKKRKHRANYHDDVRSSAVETKSLSDPFQSICVVCKKLAMSCKGDFEVNRDHVLITLPVTLPVISQGDTANVTTRGVLNAGHLKSLGSARVSDQFNQDLEQFSDLPKTVQEIACAYMTDIQLEGLFVDVLARIPGASQLTIHRVLNSIDLKIREVVIVQSLEAFEEIRRTSFTGKIVLFTERMSYLDKQERSLFDFVLPLPPSDEDFHNFLVFLRQTIRQAYQNIDGQSSRHRDSAVSDTHSVLSALAYRRNLRFGARMVDGVKKIWRKFVSIVPSIKNKLEDYGWWRFMNPAADIYHHSVHLEIFGVSMIVFYVMLAVIGVTNFLVMILAVAGGLILLQRRSLYSCIRRSLSFYVFWYTHSISAVLVSMIGSFAVWVNRYSNGSHEKYSTPEEFLATRSTDFLNFSGLQKLFFVLCFPVIASYFMLWMPFQPALVGLLIVMIRCYFYLLIDFVAFVDYADSLLFTLVFTTIAFLTFGSLFRNESISRKSFLLLYDLVMGQAYLESCLTLVRHINPSVQRLLTVQEITVDVLLDASIHHRLIVHDPLVQSIHNLQNNLALGKQLSLEMSIIDADSYFGEHRTDVLDRMHASLLQRVVSSACRRYTSECQSLSIQMNVRIAAEVLIVRVDEAVIGGIVSRLCQRAIKRIQDSISLPHRLRLGEEQNRQMSVKRHHILIYVESQSTPKGKTYRFTDVRRLRIIALDSAPLDGELIPEEHMGISDFGDDRRRNAMFQGDKHSGPVKTKHFQLNSSTIFPFLAGGVVNEDETTTHIDQLIQNGIKMERKRFFSLPLSDKHVEYFRFEQEDNIHYYNGSSKVWTSRCRGEEGKVHRGFFKSYQSAVAPYLLCSDADKYKQYLKRTVLNRIWRVDSLSRNYFPQYLNLCLAKSLASDQSDGGDSIAQVGERPAPWKEATVRHQSYSTQQQMQQSYRHSSSHKSSSSQQFRQYSHHHPHHSPYPSQSNPNDGNPATNNSSNNNMNNEPGDGSNLALFVAPHGQLRRSYREIYSAFTTVRKGRCRLHELNARVMQSFSMPDMSLYTGEEIIVIEYAPVLYPTRSKGKKLPGTAGGNSAFGSASASSSAALNGAGGLGVMTGGTTGLTQHNNNNSGLVTWTQAMHDPEYDNVRSLVHYLRLHGFPGVVIIIGPPLSGAPPLHVMMEDGYIGFYDADNSLQYEESDIVATLPPKLQSRDAALADAYISLPMTPEKLQYIIALKERRIIEVVLTL